MDVQDIASYLRVVRNVSVNTSSMTIKKCNYNTGFVLVGDVDLSGIV